MKKRYNVSKARALMLVTLLAERSSFTAPQLICVVRCVARSFCARMILRCSRSFVTTRRIVSPVCKLLTPPLPP
jgi:hypothetical protein